MVVRRLFSLLFLVGHTAITSFCSAEMILPSKKPICIFIDGLYGAGKSTLTEIIKKDFSHVAVLEEPAERWFDVHGQGNLWELFLQDPKRWAFSIEVYIPLVRLAALENLLKLTDKEFIFVDRSIYADRYSFARFAHENGSMNNLEWAMYEEWFDRLIGYSPKPDGFIYLRVAPEETLKRIKSRGRSEEQAVPLTLLEKFQQYDDEFFITQEALPKSLAQTPILVLQGDDNFKDNETSRANMLSGISAFMQKVKQGVLQATAPDIKEE